MTGEHRDTTAKIIKLLEIDFEQTIKDSAEKLGANRAFSVGYLRALENQSYVESKRMGFVNTYFKGGKVK
jgi:Mn-dependent DtxR family transcriptional regulator